MLNPTTPPTQMKTITLIFITAILFTFSNCNDEDTSLRKEKKVKYEITGDFTGKFLIVYTDVSGSNKTLTDIPTPWSQAVTYPASTFTVGIGAQASVTGSPGQTATLKIFVDGKEVESSTATAGSFGEMVLQTITYSF
jgi:hypothetical protein